jgi:glycosyltransferase involved in cell wall biosynthesis
LIKIAKPGIDPEAFTRLPKTAHPQFLYLGRLKPYKNIDVAIKAFVNIVKSYPTARLVIAGEGENAKQLKELTESLKLTESVSFLGKVTSSEKSRLLAISWIALQPSSFEGWGLTVIEANAAGTPVIAANVNGLKDSVIAGKTGLLVPRGNINELTKTMELLISSSGYRKKLSEAAFVYAQEFDWEITAGEFQDIIINEITKKRDFPLLRKLIVVRDI